MNVMIFDQESKINVNAFTIYKRRYCTVKGDRSPFPTECPNQISVMTDSKERVITSCSEQRL
jgi:hypothetical protein